MYDFMKVFLGAIIICLGLFMAIFPKAATKKDLRDDENAVAKNRKGGIVMIVMGVVVILITNFLF